MFIPDTVTTTPQDRDVTWILSAADGWTFDTGAGGVVISRDPAPGFGYVPWPADQPEPVPAGVNQYTVTAPTNPVANQSFQYSIFLVNTKTGNKIRWDPELENQPQT